MLALPPRARLLRETPARLFATVDVRVYVNRSAMVRSGGLTVDNSPESLAPQVLTVLPNGSRLIDGVPQGTGPGERDLRPGGSVTVLPNGSTETGPLGPIEFLRTIQNSEIALWRKKEVKSEDGT